MRLSLFLVLVVGFGAACLNFADAEKQVTITQPDDAVDDIATKIKSNSGKLRGGTSAAAKGDAKLKEAATIATSSIKNWDDAIGKMKSGAKLKPLETASGKWKGDFDKLKASGQLKDLDEKQAAKLTEDVAQEVVKNPSKGRRFKKALEIAFGVGVTSLIAVGLNVMAS
ncbi:hypothetical protein GN244_ATG08391 [Phytophthora infestans]|uniref:Secreted RxLR effector peptide protein n=1 Tax=Phytophthora infestans TaxID=4787 RepID=A0A833SSE0_PHYIN|nr:hypothetical protein GN244_ATG08391 [Phytophthora infestans]